MGVRGLATYVNAGARGWFDDVTLENCALIIDGNNLIVKLAIFQKGSAVYGGDYDVFGLKVEKFFKQLRQSNIRPIVVLDGGLEGRKYKTVIQRQREKIRSMEKISPRNPGLCVPLLSRTLFREKLKEMGVVVLVADLEADQEIAALARFYGAPVLSDDSDFFIFPVLCVPLASFKFHRGKATGKLFRIDKFSRQTGVARDEMPLLAVALGNDYIPRTAFQAFFRQIRMDSSPRLTVNQRKVSGFVTWLGNQRPGSALPKILSCTSYERRDALKGKIEELVNSYIKLSPTLQSHIPDNLKLSSFQWPNSQEYEKREVVDNELLEENEDDCIYSLSGLQLDESDEEEEVEIPDNSVSIPSWLRNRSQQGLVGPEILTIFSVKSYFFCPQPECYQLPFSGEPYLHLVQLLSGLLLGEDKIQVWKRRGNRYERIMMDTQTSIGSLQPFPSIESIGSLNKNRRKIMFNEIVELSHLNGIPPDWTLHFVSVILWLRNDSEKSLKPRHLHSVMMMIAAKLLESYEKKSRSKKGRIVPGPEPSDSTIVPNNLVEALQKVNTQDFVTTARHLSRFFRAPKLSDYSTLTVHVYAQLQHSITLVTLFNDALGWPYPNVNLHKFYNSTFLYNMTSNLDNRRQVSSYAHSHFTYAPTALAVYLQIEKTLSKFYSGYPEGSRKKKNERPV